MYILKMLFSIKPLSSPSGKSCCFCVRGIFSACLKTSLSNNYRIIDLPYRSHVFFTHRIIDLSIIEPSYLRKLSIHRYRSMKLVYRTNDYRLTKKLSSAHL